MLNGMKTNTVLSRNTAGSCSPAYRKIQNRESLSSFQTLVVSTATRVGMGNLVGVVAAVSAGGAGPTGGLHLLCRVHLGPEVSAA